VDGEHRTLQHVRALLGEQAGKLRLFAGFQDENAIAVQSVSHDLALTRFCSNAGRLLFVHHDAPTGIGARAFRVIEQAANHRSVLVSRKSSSSPCPIISSF
jgi:hypothetical protein